MNATSTVRRMSPVHEELAHAQAQWGDLAGMPVAIRCGAPAQEERNLAAVSV
nr:hypothetical protein [Planctomycetota bacterium]